MSILSSNRPIPNLQDQHTTFENQFSGMTVEPFTYEDFETTRKDLIALFFKRWEGFPNLSGKKLRNGHAFVRILSAKFNSIKKTSHTSNEEDGYIGESVPVVWA